MKRVILLLFFLTYGLFASANQLKILNWPEYIDVEILKEFTSKTGIPIKYELYKNNEQLIHMLDSKESYDIVFPSSSFLKTMIQKNLILQIDQSKLKNYDQIDSFFFSNPELKEYAIPYTWGTTGIIYNKNLISMNSFADLWSKKLNDKLFILDDMNDMFAIAFSVLGIDINTQEEDDIKKGYEKLVKLIPNIKGIFEDSEKLAIEFKNENILASIAYNGDIIDIVQNSKYKYLHPKEGALLWIDTICIDATTQNKEGVYKFIDFLISKEKSLQNFKEIGYAIPIKGIEYDKKIYPNEKDRKKLKSLTAGNAEEIYEKYWNMFLNELSKKGVKYE